MLPCEPCTIVSSSKVSMATKLLYPRGIKTINITWSIPVLQSHNLSMFFHIILIEAMSQDHRQHILLLLSYPNAAQDRSSKTQLISVGGNCMTPSNFFYYYSAALLPKRYRMSQLEGECCIVKVPLGCMVGNICGAAYKLAPEQKGATQEADDKGLPSHCFLFVKLYEYISAERVAKSRQRAAKSRHVLPSIFIPEWPTFFVKLLEEIYSTSIVIAILFINTNAQQFN